MPPSSLTVCATQRCDVSRPGHVRDHGQGRAARFFDLRHYREQLGFGAADQRDGGALGGQGERDAAADPLAAAGDDGSLAVQCPCHDLSLYDLCSRVACAAPAPSWSASTARAAA